MIAHSRLTAYRLVSSSMTALEIATPIVVTFRPEDIVDGSACAEFNWNPEASQFGIVRDEDQVYGELGLEDIDLEQGPGFAKDKAIPITVDMVIPASTPLLELPALFLKRYYFYLLSARLYPFVGTAKAE